MRVFTLVWLIFTTFAVQADLLKSLQAYENKNYAEAKSGFLNLLPLGNADAAFNLGVMAYYGQGEEVSKAQALAYFMLADQLQHADVGPVVQRVYAEVTREERLQAEADAAKAFAAVIIKQDARPYLLSQEQPPAAITAPMPTIPDDVTRLNPFGYVVIQYLVDGSGQVRVADVVDGFPAGAYDTYALRAMRRWQYEATGRAHLMSTQLNFWIPGGMNARSANKIVNQNNIWTYAQVGSGRHQETLGSALNVIAMVSGVLVFVEDDLPEPGAELDLSAWFDNTKHSFNLPSLDGHVVVQTNAAGEIEQVVQSDALLAPSVDTLLGLKIRGAQAGFFQLSNSISQQRGFTRVQKQKKVFVQQYVPVHQQLTPAYWWHKAAINGDRRAQRILGAKREDWQFYLIQQDDPMAAAWHGARLVLDGEDNQGKALLQQAQAAGYAPATDLLNALAL